MKVAVLYWCLLFVLGCLVDATGCNTAALVSMGYSREQLLSIREGIPSNIRLPAETMKQIRMYGLNEIPATIRGKRGGKYSTNPHNMISDVSTPTSVSHESPSAEDHPNVTDTKTKFVKAGLINCQSVNNKHVSIVDHILSSGLDIIGLNETWLSSNDTSQMMIGNITPTGYALHQAPRAGRGGGVAFLC